MPNKKTYILYSRPFVDDNDEPPIEEVWSEGTRPKKKQADGECLYVYDDIVVDGKNTLLNSRVWDGHE